MEANPAIPSLLPYLQHGQGRFALDLSLIEPDAQKPLHGQLPFLIHSSEDPLSNLMAAAIVSDDGSPIKPLLLRVQKDIYLHPTPSLMPLTNPQVDQAWQRAHELRTQRPEPSPPITIGDQFDSAGRPRPFNALFYCRLQQNYFHPPCPHCGAPLEQCQDDDLLQQAQLAPYGTSLKRYLHCRICHTRGTSSPFYSYDRQPTDPDWLYDRRQLIHGFGQLPPETAKFSHIPCPTCPNHGLCFGREDLAQNYITFLSFYPFHMMLFEAGSLMATDFISVISGAAITELIQAHQSTHLPGRLATLRALEPKGPKIKTGFLFSPREPRFFLEILFLKLRFLQQLARSVLTQIDTYQYPDLGLAFDCIWVQISESDASLPYWWNFKIQRNDIGQHLAESPHLPPSPPSYGLNLLGLAWFYTLATNSRQSIADLYPVLTQFMDGQEDLPAALADSSNPNLPPAFTPNQIFWNPEVSQVPSEFGEFWHRSLALGGVLLQSSHHFQAEWSQEQFLQSLDQLENDIHHNLFDRALPEATAASTSSDIQGEEIRIHAILGDIIAKWHQTSQKPAPLPSSPPPGSEPATPTQPISREPISPDSVETVIIRRPQVSHTPEPPRIDPEATVILSHNGKPAGKPRSPAADSPWGNDQRVKKAQSPQPSPSTPQQRPTAFDEEDDLAETVIHPRNRPRHPGGSQPPVNGPGMSPSRPTPKEKEAQPLTPGPTPSSELPSDENIDEDLPETVIMKPTQGGRRSSRSNVSQEPSSLWQPKPDPVPPPPVKPDTTPSPPPFEEDDDLLTETVILRPGKDKP